MESIQKRWKKLLLNISDRLFDSLVYFHRLFPSSCVFCFHASGKVFSLSDEWLSAGGKLHNCGVDYRRRRRHSLVSPPQASAVVKLAIPANSFCFLFLCLFDGLNYPLIFSLRDCRVRALRETITAESRLRHESLYSLLSMKYISAFIHCVISSHFRNRWMKQIPVSATKSVRSLPLPTPP